MFTQNSTQIYSTAAPPPRSPGAHVAPASAPPAYAARRGYAFDLAETAYWRGAICADAYMLFRLLTRLCKDRSYCWPGLEYLAAQFQTSVGTIKRRLERLERAGLIERRQRAGGLTSYTYVLPLREYDAGTADADQGEACPAIQSPEAENPSTSRPAHAPAGEAPPPLPPAAQSRPDPALFFAPSQQITAAPPDRSPLIPLKSQNSTVGGGEICFISDLPCDPVLTALQNGGVLAPAVLHELRGLPLAEVEACLRFARRQPNIVDPAAFAVALLRQGLGPRLAQHGDRAGPPSRPLRTPASPAHSVSARRGTALADTCRSARDAVDQQGGSTPYDAVWAAVLAQLKPSLSPDEFAAWFSDTALVYLQQRRAVIDTPNVFVRDHLAGTYQTLLSTALETVLGHPVAVELGIGSTSDS